MLEEEIDLRPYLLLFTRLWWVIGITTIIGFLVTLFLLTLYPPQFQATAIVAIIEAKDLIQFDPRFTETREEQPLNAFPELALSDEVLTLVKSDLGFDALSLEEFRGKLNAQSGLDSTVLRLTVVDTSPNRAAEIANTWAAHFVDWGNEIYLGQSASQVQFYQDQLFNAEARLAEKNQELIDFQQINESAVISNTIAFYQQHQFLTLERQKEVELLQRNVSLFQTQLAQRPSTSPINVSDQITYLQLQVRTFNDDETIVPLIVDTPLNSVVGEPISVNEQIQLLEGLSEALNENALQIEAEIDLVGPIILDLQKQRQSFVNRELILQREHGIAEETAVSLAFKLEEEKIKAEDDSRGFRVASQASTPANPLTTRNTFINALGGIIGFIVGTILLFVLAFRKGNQEEPITPPATEKDELSSD